MAKNFQDINTFAKGMSYDIDNHAEQKETYIYGLNGRIYSKDGVLSFCSIDGTVEKYADNRILKVLGAFSFDDEFVVYAKTSEKLDSYYEELDIPDGGLFCDDDEEEIDYSLIYTLSLYEMNFNDFCIDPKDDSTQIGYDTIFIFSLNEDDEVVSKVLYSDFLNWGNLNDNRKIISLGVDENIHYKRVYLTDNVNEIYVVNLKDAEIAKRKKDDLKAFQKSTLIEPLIESIQQGGSIKSSTCFYVYRLITANGQYTEFSDLSKPAYIYPEADVITGGDISEQTNKKVNVKVFIPDHKRFEFVEIYALEFETQGLPTAIRNLGTKKSKAVVRVSHVGTEQSLGPDLAISEILNRKDNWRYCSTFNSLANRLYAGGLRNKPINVDYNLLQKDFALRAWDKNGETFECLLNPNPMDYRYTFVDPIIMSGKTVKAKMILFTEILSFSSVTVTLADSETGLMFQKEIIVPENNYINILPKISEWINDNSIAIHFENLKIEASNSYIRFERINQSQKTDLSRYVFEFSNEQIIVNSSYENENIFPNTPTISNSPEKYVYGYTSNGFHSGNGIRISFRDKLSHIMYSSDKRVEDIDSNIFDLGKPSMKKGFMKGEVYRIGVQFELNDNENMFVIPIGDIYVPEIGEKKKYISDFGDIVQLEEKYQNSRDEMTISGRKILMLESLRLRVEFRLACHLQRKIKSFKLVYVERDGENSRIHSQGLASPMERYTNSRDFKNRIAMKEEIANKWVLPFNGGPTYDAYGITAAQNYGVDYDTDNDDGDKRVIVNLNLINYDSPDIVFGRRQTDSIKGKKASLAISVKSDHQDRMHRQTNYIHYQDGDLYTIVLNPEYGQTYSKKIFGYIFPEAIYTPGQFVLGNVGIEEFEQQISVNSKNTPSLVNASVFSNYEHYPYFDANISHAKELNEGEIIPGVELGVDHQVSNNAMTLDHQTFFHNHNHRAFGPARSGGSGHAQYEYWMSNQVSTGQRTVIMKLDAQLIMPTDEQTIFAQERPQTGVRLVPDGGFTPRDNYYTNYSLINIINPGKESYYGGYTDYAYANNRYIQLSGIIPVEKTENKTQIIEVEGDTFTSIFIRVKNTTETPYPLGDGYGSHDGDTSVHYAIGDRAGAWAYAVPVETTVEPLLTSQNLFFRQSKMFSFKKENESINEAYLQTGNLRSYIPKPFNFKEDPLMLNYVAVSELKITASNKDGWTEFKINNFYELEKNKGAVNNIAKHLDRLYAIQKTQTSLLQTNLREIIDGSEGPIVVKSGSGTLITDHKIVSDYGTGIRRNTVAVSSNSGTITGFYFYDENKNEIVKITEPILAKHLYHLNHLDLLDYKRNEIIDVEGYYDDTHKETIVRLRTSNGNYFTYSINELSGILNGFFEYNNDIYIPFKNRIFTTSKKVNGADPGAPLIGTPNQDIFLLHELNAGKNLKIFGDNKSMRIKIIINAQPLSVKIFKHIAGIININFPIDKIVLNTSLGQTRIITGDHHMYKIREGRHSVPLKNRMDWDDLRGEWATIEVYISNKEPFNKINIFSFINFVRNSYQ